MKNEILQGDVLKIARTLADESANCIVTSQPYFNLRDYGLPPSDWPEVAYAPMPGLPKITVPAMTCCLGLEDSIEAYVAHTVLVWREMWRVLRGDGVGWLNLGDSYSSNASGQNGTGTSTFNGSPDYGANQLGRYDKGVNIKPKNLCGIPWRCAFALQADGWYLRSDIIWAKKNPMPESCQDRPTKAHEYLFLLAKSERYWYDADAIRGPNSENTHGGKVPNVHKLWSINGASQKTTLGTQHQGRNARTVWSISSVPYKEAHFAVFPPKLIEPCIRAGCPTKVCVECGQPWVRVVERKKGQPANFNGSTFTNGKTGKAQSALSAVGKKERTASVKTLGFAPTCQCNGHFETKVIKDYNWQGDKEIQVYIPHIPLKDHPTRPGIVLDPFFGSGTTAKVAIENGCDWLGIELNPEYTEMAEERIARTQQPLFVI